MIQIVFILRMLLTNDKKSLIEFDNFTYSYNDTH